MGSVVLKSLSVLLGLFFIFIGTMKLTSFISKDLHKDLVRKSGNCVGREARGWALSVTEGEKSLGHSPTEQTVNCGIPPSSQNYLPII